MQVWGGDQSLFEKTLHLDAQIPNGWATGALDNLYLKVQSWWEGLSRLTLKRKATSLMNGPKLSCYTNKSGWLKSQVALLESDSQSVSESLPVLQAPQH